MHLSEAINLSCDTLSSFFIINFVFQICGSDGANKQRVYTLLESEKQALKTPSSFYVIVNKFFTFKSQCLHVLFSKFMFTNTSKYTFILMPIVLLK